MKALLVDTAGWVACADAADPDHEATRAARDEALEARRVLVTTDRHFRQAGFLVVP